MAQLVSIDYSGIEALLTGWFMRDPQYMRLARLGVHAYLCSHLVGKPADLRWSDLDLIGYFAEIKEAHDDEYDKAKRCVHGTNYGLTPHGMAERFPDIYPSRNDALRVQKLYFNLCPKLPAFQQSVINQAFKYHFWGGAGMHPYNYKHYFFDVKRFRPVTQQNYRWRVREGYPAAEIQGAYFAVEYGEDAKRCLAFPAQSTACGVIKEAGLRLFAPPEISGFGENYIGDLWFGRTPLRALVHDEFLLEVPDALVDRAVAALVKEMRRPVLALPCLKEWDMGEFLSIGVEVRVGKCWAKKRMAKVDIGGIEVPGSPWALEAEHEELEDALVELRAEVSVAEEDDAPEEDAAMQRALVG